MKMSENRQMGRPHTLTQQKSDAIVANINKVLVLNQAAAMAKVLKSTAQMWMVRGREDVENNIDSVEANFVVAVKSAQAKKVEELLTELREMPRGWQALAWILERCFREEFGADAGIIQELKAEFEAIKAMKMNGQS